MAKKKTGVEKETLGKVLRYVRRHSGWLVVSLVMAALSVAGALYLPVLTGRAVDCIIRAGEVNFTSIKDILRQMGLLILLTAAVQWVMNVCNNRITYDVVRDLREDAFKRIEELPLKYLDSHQPGEIVSRVKIGRASCRERV